MSVHDLRIHGFRFGFFEEGFKSLDSKSGCIGMKASALASWSEGLGLCIVVITYIREGIHGLAPSAFLGVEVCLLLWRTGFDDGREGEEDYVRGLGGGEGRAREWGNPEFALGEGKKRAGREGVCGMLYIGYAGKRLE